MQLIELLFVILDFLQGMAFRLTGINSRILALLILASPLFILILGATFPRFAAEILLSYFGLMLVAFVVALFRNARDYQQDREEPDRE